MTEPALKKLFPWREAERGLDEHGVVHGIYFTLGAPFEDAKYWSCAFLQASKWTCTEAPITCIICLTDAPIVEE